MKLYDYLKRFDIKDNLFGGFLDARRRYDASYVLASIHPDIFYAIMETTAYGIDRKVRALGMLAGDPECFGHLKVRGAHMNTNARATERELRTLYRLGKNTPPVMVSDCALSKAAARKQMRAEMESIQRSMFAPPSVRYYNPVYLNITGDHERRLMLAIRTGE